ncbi:hypothetical protein PInf_001635 [Phytophthora infestans]|nr:hypothetical protein PInf_000103 [Phytophthora infestans]KAI9997704.1 hypothetical protein PInf_001635 [Phytophthora infestans]
MAAPIPAGSQRKFGPKWELKYAVAVTERDQLTQIPTKAVCLMCQAFEREEAVGSKRKKTSRVRSFLAPWRPDNMKRHMEQQHPLRWEEYQKLTDGEKRVYFSAREVMAMSGGDDAVPSLVVPPMVSEPTPSAEAYALAAQYRAFLVDKDIVEELIAGVLFQTTNDEYRNAWNVPLTFTLLEEASAALNNADIDVNESRYVARVESLLKFNMCLKYVAMGLSLSQVVPLLQKTAEETGMDASLSGSSFTEQQLACLCRVACAVNFQTLKDTLRRVWAFTIALEQGNDAASPYLDVRRFMAGLTSLVGHFRRQRALIREMNGEMCPKFEDGQWRSVASVLKWFTVHRARLFNCVQDTQPPGAPGKEWWVTVIAVNGIMERVNVALTMLRGPSAALGSARREYVAKLVTDLAVVTGTLGPLAVSQQSNDHNIEFGDFSMSREAAISFLKEQGSFVMNAVNELEVNFPACCQAAVESTANFAVSVIARTHQIMLECDENSNSTASVNTAMPPFLPQELCKTRNQLFATHLQAQRVRLLQHYSADQIEQIEDQHRMLRTSYQLDEHYYKPDSIVLCLAYEGAEGFEFYNQE